MTKTAKRTAAKRRAKKATKRKATSRKATKRKAARAPSARAKRLTTIGRQPHGFVKTKGGVLVQDHGTPVPMSKLRKGLVKAKTEIHGVLQDLVDTMTGDYAISEVELTASFNADGKFMGFGVGGDASIKIKIVPVD